MSRYIISFFITLLSLQLSAQEKSLDSIEAKDTIVKTPLKIRFGFDTGGFVWAKLHDSEKLSFFVDANVYKNYLAFLELGYEDKHIANSFLDYNTSGNFVKLGVDYNLYNNWLDMDNDITIGLRYGQAFYKTRLNNYTINQQGAAIVPEPIAVNTLFDRQSASWIELVSTVQVETFKHVYLGYSIAFKRIIYHTKPDNFETAYIPGFNKRNAYSSFGFGMQYFISYRIKF